MCSKCSEPYFGGMKVCDAGQMEEGEYKPEELVCAKCSAVGINALNNICEHGTDYIDFKCKFCCSVALWFCWGNTHFCDPCHRIASKAVVKPCKGPG